MKGKKREITVKKGINKRKIEKRNWKVKEKEENKRQDRNRGREEKEEEGIYKRKGRKL